MPIPDCNDEGLLPAGVHVCTLGEVKERFGSFQGSDRRCRLFEKLAAFVEEVRATGLVACLIVNGSFVTGKDAPNDIDLIVVLHANHDFAATLKPFQYNVVSRRRVHKRHGFDVLVGPEGSELMDEYVAFFQEVRGKPELHKGVLRVDP